MKLIIKDQILQKFPHTCIGFLIAKVNITKTHPLAEELKNNLPQIVRSNNITAENYASHSDIKSWRDVYVQMGLKPKERPSSLEALIKRIVKGQSIWNISSVVDIYNCISATHMLPMGGYDLSKIEGDIELRFGNETDEFYSLGSAPVLKPRPEEVVYGDAKKVLCWAWNHKDSRFSAITEATTDLIVFFDAMNPKTSSLEKAILDLSLQLQKLGGQVVTHGILNQQQPSIDLAVARPTSLDQKKTIAEIPNNQKVAKTYSFKWFDKLVPDQGIFHELVNIVTTGDVDAIDAFCNQYGTEKLKLTSQSGGLSLLHYAARQGDLIMLQKLHAYGLNLNVIDTQGRSPIFSLLYAENIETRLEILQWMRTNGVNLDSTDINGDTPYSFSARDSQLQPYVGVLTTMASSRPEN
ncbi:MAG: hypothetical protein A3F18_00595 [Legionellales bacterium RIFCSPHIGHO2_12_FULL_37_14]|nr:MAG: hypothetical protein A3F18_00595 [Legionellales bacterium RIFCSPHIGHO2_12_FULL_37_14]